MRVEHDDPICQSHKVKVFLGGVEISKVTIADEEGRYIERFKTDERGLPVPNEAGDAYLTERLRGDVAIVLEPR
jgi:hypothetical protein